MGSAAPADELAAAVVEETLAALTRAAAGRVEPGRIAALTRFTRAATAGLSRAAHDDPRRQSFLVVVRTLAQAEAELRAGDEARAFEQLALAERFAWRARLPRIVCVAGLTASGKSTLADALGAASGLPVLSSDFVRRARAGLESGRHAAPSHYARHINREVYGSLGRAAAAAVRSDGGAIVDATFRHPDDTAAFTAAARDAAWIVCEAPADVLLERARWRAARGGTGADADPALVAVQLARRSGPLPLPVPPLAVLETVEAVPRLVDSLAATLDARLALGASHEPEDTR